MTLLVIVILLLICIVLIGWSLFLYRRLTIVEDLAESRVARYYETAQWQNGKEGIHYAQNDETMGSLLYLPKRKIVCWFSGRKIAHVKNNGDFAIRLAHGAEIKGNVRDDNDLELVNGEEISQMIS